jgi:hypothetical protein
MGWERRTRGGLYYTRSRREGGRVVREYVGAGVAAELSARLDAARREKAERQRAEARVEAERLDAAEATLDDLCEAADTLAGAALLAAGYHRHDRGEWRRRRGQRDRAKARR